MKNKKLLEQIFFLTEKIQVEFPAYYKLLTETPMWLSNEEKGINEMDFRQYLESLKTQLEIFEKPSFNV